MVKFYASYIKLDRFFSPKSVICVEAVGKDGGAHRSRRPQVRKTLQENCKRCAKMLVIL